MVVMFRTPFVETGVDNEQGRACRDPHVSVCLPRGSVRSDVTTTLNKRRGLVKFSQVFLFFRSKRYLQNLRIGIPYRKRSKMR